MKTTGLLRSTSWEGTSICHRLIEGDDLSSLKFMSTPDRLKHATVDKSEVGIPLCQWERDSQGALIASWRLGCSIGSRTRLGGQSTHPPASRQSPDCCAIDTSVWPGWFPDPSGNREAA